MAIWQHVSDIRGERPISSPEELWFFAVSYFEYVRDNPLYSTQVVKYPLRHELVSVPQMQVMTLKAFFIHAGITAKAFAECEERPEFQRVCEIIKSIIHDQKFSGAAAGLLKEALITRDLGLADKVDHTSSDGSLRPTHITIEAAGDAG